MPPKKGVLGGIACLPLDRGERSGQERSGRQAVSYFLEAAGWREIADSGRRARPDTMGRNSKPPQVSPVVFPASLATP